MCSATACKEFAMLYLVLRLCYDASCLITWWRLSSTLCSCLFSFIIAVSLSLSSFFLSLCPHGLTSHGGDVAVYVFNINQLSLPTLLYSVLASVSVFMALSTVFHSINCPDNSPLSHSVLLVLFLPHCSFQLYISL